MNQKTQIFSDFEGQKIDVYQTIKLLAEYYNTESNVKENGVVYTPKYIADFIVQNLKYQKDKTILEPSAGHGVFIFSLIEYVEKTFNLTPKKLYNWFMDHVFAIELQDEYVQDLRKLLKIYFENKGIKEFDSRILREKNILSKDTLFEETNHYDFCIGNPPYVRIQNLSSKYRIKLKNNFETCELGNSDIYYAFVEYAIKHSTIFSFIIPKSFFDTKSGNVLRSKLKNNITDLIDFGTQKIFEGIGAYTTIIRGDSSEIQTKFNFYEKSLEVSPKTLENNKFLLDEKWNLNTNKVQTKNGSFLRDCTIIHGPVATLKDKIFICDKSNSFEEDMLVPFFKLTKIEEKEFKNPKHQIIFPYDEELIIKPEKEIKKYTNVWNHLVENKTTLLKRDKGKTDDYEAWYAYGRRQGIQKYEKNSWLVLIPQMIQGQEQILLIKNHPEQFLFTSGFIVEIPDNDLKEEIANELCNDSSFFEYIKFNGKEWPGEFYTFSANVIKNYRLETIINDMI